MAKYSYAVKNLLKMDGIDPEKIGKPAAGKAAPIDPARSAEQRSDIQAQKDAEEFSKVDESALKIRSVQAMKDQEEFAEGADVPSVSKIRADAAKKQLQRYQEQYDRKTKARTEKQKKDQFYSDLITGNPDIIIPEDAPDEEEKRLKAQLDRAQREADYWDGQLKQEQEAATRRADMAEVESWDEADREELERYIWNRQSAFVQSLNPALTGLPAQYEDSYLIEKYGRERLDEIARSYQREQNAAKYEQAAQEGRDMAKGGLAKNIGGNLLSVGANLADTLLDPLTRIAQGAGGKDDRYSTLDPYAGGQARAFASGVREQTVENIEGEDPTAARKGFSYLYQGGMAAADSLARATVGGSGTVGAGLAALGSFNQTLSQASAQGASPEQAYTLATINSGIEAATEKIPLDELFKIAKGGKKPAIKAVGKILKSMGIEAATEELSLVGTTLAEAAILQEKSNYNQKVMMDVLSGKSLQEAKEDANWALLEEAIHTAIVSGISGGISAGGAQIIAGRNGGVQGAQTAQAAQAEIQLQQAPEAAQPAAEQQAEQNWMEKTFRETMGTDSQKQEVTETGNQQNDQIGTSAVDTQMYENVVLGEAVRKVAETGSASNSIAADVMNNPAALRRLVQETGIKLEGTKAERRKAVKEALNFLNSKTQIRNSGEHGNDSVAGAMHDGQFDSNWMANAFRDMQNEKSAAQNNQTPVAQGKAGKISVDDLTKGLFGSTKDDSSASDDGRGVGTVGAAKSRFQHDVRESGVYANTYRNANNDTVRAIGDESSMLDPNIRQYDVVTEEESLNEARLRTETGRDRYAEHRSLLAKDGWSGADNDTAMRLLAAYRKEGKADRFRELAKKQREMGTQAGQMAQSFAKYSREDATTAVLDAVKALDEMGVSDVPKKFWKKGIAENSRHAHVGNPDDYSDTLAGEMSDVRQDNTIFSKRKMDKQNFENWKTSVTKSMLEIANDIEGVQENDVEAMRGIVRQLAQFRRTTAWFGTQDRLTRNADRILNKVDFDTAKTIAKAQLAMIPDDFRKRSAGETAKTIRIHNMLSALTTTSRNTIGNATMGIMDAFSDSITARAMDIALSRITGIRTVGNDLKHGKTYFNAARDAADMAALCVELNIPLASESRYSAGNTRMHTTQGGPLGRFLSAYEKYLKYSLEVTDKFFEGGSMAAVNKSIRDLGAKTGLSEEQVSGLAQRAGKRRTFKEDRNLSRGAKKIKEGANTMFGAGEVGAGDILMPFAGVPMDIGQTAADYSGSGMVLGLKEMIDVIQAAKNGEKTIKNKRTGAEMPLEIAQRKAVSDFGRGVTGIGLIALSAAASAMGAIKVHNSDDWEKKGLEQAQNLDGAQINLSAIWRGLSGDNSGEDPMKWRSGEDVVLGMDFLEPFNSCLNIGYMISQEPDIAGMVKNYPKHALLGVMDAMTEMPVMTLLSEIQDLVKSLGETDEEGNPATMDAMGQVAGTIASSVVPSFIRQTAQTIDPYYRDTYDSNPWKQAGNQLLASFPLASKTLPEKYDGLGNVQKRYDDTTTGGKVMGMLNNLFLPDDVEKIGGNAITDYLSRLSTETGETSMYPEEQAPYKFTIRGEEIELTGDQRVTYQKTYGEKNNELYGGLIGYPGFRELPEDVQITAFGRAKSYATQYAKASVSDYRNVPEETTGELVKKIVNDSVSATFTNAFSDLTESWDYEYDDSNAQNDLSQAYEVYKSMPDVQRKEFYENATGRVKYYLEARKVGISTEKFAKLYEEYRDIDESQGMTSTEKAHEWATVLEESVDDGYITEVQKDRMKENMVFRYSLQAETMKFDAMIDAGIPTSKAKQVVDTVANVQGTGSWDMVAKKYTVREIDKREAIAKTTGLSEKEIDAVMKCYMEDYDPKSKSPEKTEVKYEYAREVVGLTPEEYVETYRAYLDSSKRDERIKAIMALGYNERTATALYDLYYGNQKKVPAVAWYEKKHGL